MSSETLTMVAAAALSLAFSYVPGLQARFERLTPTGKRLAMLAMLGLVAAGAYGLACSGWGEAVGVTLACDAAGALGLGRAFILAVIANQSAYLISPQVTFEKRAALAARRAGR